MGNTEAERIRDVVRGKDPMRSLCQEKLITPEACDWVKYALDPFHDLQLDNLRGYPDVSTEPTVVVKIRQAATISAPAGLPAGKTWDCHMVLSPIDYMPSGGGGTLGTARGVRALPHGDTASALWEGQSGLVVPGAAQDGGPLTARMDGLVINSVPGGDFTFTPEHCPVNGGTAPIAGYEVNNITLDDYLDFEPTDLAVYRLVYSGFEVVNTTAQISKQGAVTVYEYGNSYESASSTPDSEIRPVSTSPYQLTGTYNPTTYFRCPPNTLAEAKIMPASHSWAAQDGSYNTAKFQTDNPFQSLTKRNWIVCQNRNTAGPGDGYTADYPFGQAGEPSVSNSAGSFASEGGLAQSRNTNGAFDPNSISGSSHFSRMNTTGAYYTGLSSESTLFVTWRVGIERLPSANKPAFLALSQPSATFDPNALVLYNMVANILPPGCPQGYNDTGKWYSWIAEAAKRSIPAVYPLVRTASLLAASMGRPVLASGLTGLAGAMKPVAENMAAKRMQAAVRGAQSRKGKPAVQNWSKGKGAPGGRNGLR